MEQELPIQTLLIGVAFVILILAFTATRQCRREMRSLNMLEELRNKHGASFESIEVESEYQHHARFWAGLATLLWLLTALLVVALLSS